MQNGNEEKNKTISKDKGKKRRNRGNESGHKIRIGTKQTNKQTNKQKNKQMRKKEAERKYLAFTYGLDNIKNDIKKNLV